MHGITTSHRFAIPVAAALACGLVSGTTTAPPSVQSVRFETVSVQLEALVSPFIADSVASSASTLLASAAPSAAAVTGTDGIVKRIIKAVKDILTAPIFVLQFIKMFIGIFTCVSPLDCSPAAFRTAAPAASTPVPASARSVISNVRARLETASRKNAKSAAQPTAAPSAASRVAATPLHAAKRKAGMPNPTASRIAHQHGRGA